MQCVRLARLQPSLQRGIGAPRPYKPAAMKPGSAEWKAYNDRWEEQHWSQGLPPGKAFDAAKSSAALLHLLDAGGLAVQGQRVLVPGCGRGYDVVEFANRGAAEALGLELAPSAAKVAAEYVAAHVSPATAPAAAVHQADFFAFQGDRPFDVGFDYTFMCALDPGMRPDWAHVWGRLLRPGGRLVTLMFPVGDFRPPGYPEGKPYVGPPWPVTPELYSELLEAAGFVRDSLEAVPPERSHPGRGGKEFLAVWTKQ